MISLSIVIAVAVLITVITRLIGQPSIIAYLISGIVVGPVALNLIGPSNSSSGLLQIFSHIGVAFLLFIVGLSLDFRVLKEVGKVSTIVGFCEIALTATIGFLIASGLGYSNSTALYIGAILAFSSTVVVVKILSDKKELDALHGRIALGILIIEDFVAALALMILPLIESKGDFYPLLGKFGFAIALIIGVFLFSSLFLTRVLDYLARNQELLFLFGIAWALNLASIFGYLGFSSEIGALIAGMSLASSKYTLELSGKIKPLRDFFVVIFFVFFGSQLTHNISAQLVKEAILFSVFVFFGKPIIVMTLLRFSGYKKRTNFLAGSSLAQISEFSLILALLGFNLGHLSQSAMNLAILISLITIGLSSYSIHHSYTIFRKLSKLLDVFENEESAEEKFKEKSYDVILFGYHSVGYKVVQSLKRMRKKFLVVDHNPQVIIALAKEKIDCVYGDASDNDFLGEINIEDAKMIVTTIPEDGINLSILDYLERVNPKAIFIATAKQPRSALDLYKEGADYVIVPQHLGGDYASNMISEFELDKRRYKNKGKNHLTKLREGKRKSRFL